MSDKLLDLKRRLDETAGIADLLDRRLAILAILTETLEPLVGMPVLVGGAAVEFYTLGGYATRDMDVLVPGSPRVDEAMRGLGFMREGRYWMRDDIQALIEMPAPPLAGDTQRVLNLVVRDSHVYIIGLEDLVIDRLNAYVHWKSAEDGRWAERLLADNMDSIDWDYLRARARGEGVSEALETIRKGIEQ